MLCGSYFGREILGMNKWERFKFYFIFLGGGDGKLFIIECRSVFCWNVFWVYLIIV